MPDSFWRGKRVLITGHTGFKGAWLTLWLHRLGAEVTGFALPPETDDWLFTAARAGSCAGSIFGDIRDPEALRRCFAAAWPEIVFHLAAQPIVRRSYSDPVGTYATNVMGTVHVLEAARGCAGLRVVLNVTSDKCYENREVLWGYRETDSLGGFDPYSSSKACSEIVTAAYRQSFFRGAGVRLASARAGNVIGGGDWAEDRLVPDCMRALLHGEPVAIRNPGAVRPWQHVLEPLSGYMRYVERLWERPDGLPDSLNFGPFDMDVRSVGDVVERIVQRWGGGAAWRTTGEASLHEARLLTLDSTLARHTLGWRPRWPLEEALARTVDWYRAFQDRKEDLHHFTLAQIAAYEGAGQWCARGE